MRVLIVEDDKEKLRTVEDILKLNDLDNYDVATNGVDGIMKIQEFIYDLIILDLGFSWSGQDDYADKMGATFMLRAENYYYRKKIKTPNFIIYSDTHLKSYEVNTKLLHGKASNSNDLEKIIKTWVISKKVSESPRILIIENSPYKIAGIEKILRELEITNWDIATYTIRAQKLCYERHYDCIITDIKIPERENGKEKIEHSLSFIDKLETDFGMQQWGASKLIVYSTVEISLFWKDKVPTCYCGQAVLPIALKELLRKVI